jgi:endogenous inhibitor of DNA gyrase (YacG/DUF329 family)
MTIQCHACKTTIEATDPTIATWIVGEEPQDTFCSDGCETVAYAFGSWAAHNEYYFTL